MLDAGVALPFGVRDFAERWAESRGEFKSRQEAFKATAQASAAGQDREQLKDRYVAELRSRGRQIPGEEALDAAIAAHMDSYPTGLGWWGDHSGCSAGVLDDQPGGVQSPFGSVAWPTSIRWPSGSRI